VGEQGVGVGGAGDELRGGAEGELTARILRVQKQVIRPTVAVNTEHPADSYLKN